MDPKKIFSSFFLLVFILFSVGCSGNAECGVENKDVVPFPVINPPGESGKADKECSYNKQMSIGEITESIYDGDCEFVFEESGNVYNVGTHIVITDGKISEYRLKVTGGVYGQDAHTCESN